MEPRNVVDGGGRAARAKAARLERSAGMAIPPLASSMRVVKSIRRDCPTIREDGPRPSRVCCNVEQGNLQTRVRQSSKGYTCLEQGRCARNWGWRLAGW